jgi:hypothetical protein
MTFIVDGSSGLTYPNSTLQASAGVVLQVVQGTTSTNVSTSAGAAYTDTGLTASITPKFSTSKILVMVCQTFYVTQVSSSLFAYGGIQLLRNGTVVFVPSQDGNGPYTYGITSNAATPNAYGTAMISYIDSPANTSSVTYKTQQKSYIGTTMVTQPTGASNNGTSTITLMEIAG